MVKFRQKSKGPTGPETAASSTAALPYSSSFGWNQCVHVSLDCFLYKDWLQFKHNKNNDNNNNLGLILTVHDQTSNLKLNYMKFLPCFMLFTICFVILKLFFVEFNTTSKKPVLHDPYQYVCACVCVYAVVTLLYVNFLD